MSLKKLRNIQFICNWPKFSHIWLQQLLPQQGGMCPPKNLLCDIKGKKPVFCSKEVEYTVSESLILSHLQYPSTSIPLHSPQSFQLSTFHPKRKPKTSLDSGHSLPFTAKKQKQKVIALLYNLTFLLFCFFPIPSHRITFRLYGFSTSLRVPGVFNINIFTPTESLNFIYI